ncbi:DUF7064 domain-containing protein [Pseudonocardia spinosispora]|uniref:DUF7064 domain-containing protein n=1 Tax=Pseudonocardia spinosispora TaxID=103441 RepID=UPI00041B6A64|nr:hypothetical protein [Pseudonocardia spinosispora]
MAERSGRSRSNLTPSDDRRHRPADGTKGRDSLYFNLMLPEHELGVFVYTWVDHRGVAGRLVTAWGPEEKPYAFEIEHGIDMGEADFDDWNVAGLRMRHLEPLSTAQVTFSSTPIELTYDFQGLHEAFDFDRNPLGCPRWMALNRFEQTGRASGEVRVGDRTIRFDQPAHRDHSWGRRNWRMPQHWKWIVAQTPSGQGLNLFQWVVKGELGTNGYVLRDGEPVGLVDARCRAVYDDDMTSRRLHATLVDEEGGETELVLDRFGSVALPVGANTVLNEAACRAAIDGEASWGQFETQWPASYVQNLVEART